MARAAVTARVTGRVQGVWFRAWTRETARRLGVTGWVQNEPDGSVSGLFAGDEAAVARMIQALHHGPEHARVTGVVTATADPAKAPATFDIRH